MEKSFPSKPNASFMLALKGPREGRAVEVDFSDPTETLYDKAVAAFVFVMRTFCTWAVPHLQPVLDFLVHYVFEPVGARLTGSFYPAKAILHFGQKPVSFISVTDPEFGVPDLDGQKLYDTRQFPFHSAFADAHGFHEWIAHFLILAAKVAYEREELIKDVLKHEFKGFKWVGSFYTEPKEAKALSTEDKAMCIHKAAHERRRVGLNLPDLRLPAMDKKQKLANKVTATLIPSTCAFMMTNEQSVVLFFRGTEVHKLAQWWSDCDLELAVRTNARGRVHQGFWEALFYQAPAKDGKKAFPSVFNRICTALQKETAGNNKRIFVTGHSLGGGLSAMFAHTLAHPETPNLPAGVGFANSMKLAGRVGAVYTWAAPTSGDAAFCDFLVNAYDDKLFRMVHSSDIIPKIPFGQGYRHHAREYYITYSGDIHHDPASIEAWRVCESDQFDFFYWCKLAANWGTWGPWGAPNGSFFYPDFWVFFVRCVIHSVLRVAAWLGGFLVPGHVVPGIMDHFPCDYERKIRRVALDLGVLLKTPPAERSKLRTHVLSRTEQHDACASDNPAAITNGRATEETNGAEKPWAVHDPEKLLYETKAGFPWA
ncbi:hypothetical protein WJX72_006340 [[Myrmecia] bisecta]|uniref:Fungal lipase-type domain-containing protein n=1 Tax=[Myrmecia] bisecta TaxID=41462 RepID=A0AAW1QBZ5_9CHLO